MLQVVLCCVMLACLSVQTLVWQGIAWLFIAVLWCVMVIFQIEFRISINICFEHAADGPVLCHAGMSECTDAGSTGNCLAVHISSLMCNDDIIHLSSETKIMVKLQAVLCCAMPACLSVQTLVWQGLTWLNLIVLQSSGIAIMVICWLLH